MASKSMSSSFLFFPSVLSRKNIVHSVLNPLHELKHIIILTIIAISIDFDFIS
jgi:hypothetical protein